MSKIIEAKSIEFCGTLMLETKNTYRIWDGVETIFLKKSQVLALRHICKNEWEFIIPEKLAKEKGII